MRYVHKSLQKQVCFYYYFTPQKLLLVHPFLPFAVFHCSFLLNFHTYLIVIKDKVIWHFFNRESQQIFLVEDEGMEKENEIDQRCEKEKGDCNDDRLVWCSSDDDGVAVMMVMV